MPFRFNKRISLGKLIRLNISKSGIGVSAGVPGMRITTGPRGSHVTVGIPGTGISFSKKIGDKKVGEFNQLMGGDRNSKGRSPARPPAPVLPLPGLLAPETEKRFVRALTAFFDNHPADALAELTALAPDEAGAAVLASSLLLNDPNRRAMAIQWLEAIVQKDDCFPTPMVEKYLSGHAMQIDISPTVTAAVPFDSLGVTLLLAELYQANGQVEDAITLLNELDQIADEPALTLSLCELFAQHGAWDEVIERARLVAVEDDVTLETAIWYARALLEKKLPDAAIEVLSAAVKKKKDRSEALLTDALYWRAVGYEASGKKSAASKDLQKIYAQSPAYRDVAKRLNLP